MVEAAVMSLPRPRFRLSLRGAGGWIAACGFASLFVWLAQGAPPEEQDLRHWRGPLQEVSVGREGQATWMTGEVDGVLHRFQSYHGKDWPGLDHLPVGAVVEVWYARDPLPRRTMRSGKTYWIWRLVREGEELVPYDGVAALWRRDRYWLAWAGVALLAVGLAVWLAARACAARNPGRAWDNPVPA